MTDLPPPPGGQPPYQGGMTPPPPGGYGAPPPPGGFGGASEEKNALGVWALVLGILGFLCCSIFTAIPAIFVGKASENAAAQGLATNGGLGKAGRILGWVQVILTALSVVLLVVLLGTGTVTAEELSDTYGL
ncbi:DUF4190 domain-containing protein [Demequina sp. NBRC 110057]|uniref:DUF4190 domain-containing protein n=1 Tax=Demequina sp. NBRC 110057 TaxID=1570346 RepID=UPI00190E6617|nr:DUF4190 domain-containing protein [Demequina sp. NBRC 110057]